MIDQNQRKLAQKMKQNFDAQDSAMELDYEVIKRLYNVALLDYGEMAGREFLDQRKKEAS